MINVLSEGKSGGGAEAVSEKKMVEDEAAEDDPAKSVMFDNGTPEDEVADDEEGISVKVENETPA